MPFLTTEKGHVDLAKMFVEQNTFYLGRGTLPDNYANKWTQTNVPSSLAVIHTDTFTVNTTPPTNPTLTKSPVYSVVSIKSADGSKEYTEGTDFDISENKIIWNNGEGSVPAIDEQYNVTYYYVDENITSLLKEVDCMKATVVSYCNPDSNGIIEAGGQKWTTTTQPTKFVYLYFKYPSDISLGTTFYQCGIFINRTVEEESNSPIEYEKVTDQGDLILVDNIPPFTQTELIRQYVEVVLEF